MVEHSAILISKILRASNRHFSFDGWYGPVQPIVMSKQWPAPADPLRRCEESENIRQRGVRFERWRNISQGPLNKETSVHDVLSCWFHLQRGTASCHCLVVSLQFHVFYLCLYSYFLTPLHFVLELIEQDWSLLWWKERQWHKNESKNWGPKNESRKTLDFLYAPFLWLIMMALFKHRWTLVIIPSFYRSTLWKL